MTKTKFLIAAIASIGLSGCASTLAGTNTSMYSTNQPVVERTNYLLDVNTNGGSGIAQGEMQRISEWLDNLKIGYGDRISIDYGNGYSNAAAQNAINKFAANYGINVQDVAPVTPGQIAAGTMRIIVSRSSASVPNCPNWSKATESNYHSSLSPNYGCATNSNMAAMIADPEDLVQGQADTSLSRQNGTAAVKAYRSKKNGGQ
jgi:pilus assembly protein CpaD